MDANSTLEDLRKKTVKDVEMTEDMLKNCIAKIDNFVKEEYSNNPDGIKILKEKALKAIEDNEDKGVVKVFEEVEKILNPSLRERSPFKTLVGDAIEEKATRIFKNKLFTSLDESVNEMLQDKDNKKGSIVNKDNNSLKFLQSNTNMIGDFFRSILDAIVSVFKNKNEALIKATEKVMDNINASMTKEVGPNMQKFLQSRNSDNPSMIRG